MLFPEHDVALVTGAGRGIGRAIALDLAAEGATVVLNYNKSAEGAAEVVEEISGAGGRALAIQADVSVEDEVRRLYKTIRRDLGTIRILVNNAGIKDDGFLMLMSLEKWRHVVSVNLDSAFLCSREALRLMARNKKGPRPGGAIVNITSIAGLIGGPGQLNYTASKGGLAAFTKGLAKEAAPLGVRANAVAPGFTNTEMIRAVPKAVLDGYAAVVPLQRLGEAHEVAGLVSFLASDRAGYITGQVIAVDGGFT